MISSETRLILNNSLEKINQYLAKNKTRIKHRLLLFFTSSNLHLNLRQSYKGWEIYS